MGGTTDTCTEKYTEVKNQVLTTRESDKVYEISMPN